MKSRLSIWRGLLVVPRKHLPIEERLRNLPVRVREVIERVAVEVSFTPAALLSLDRPASLTQARFALYAALREMPWGAGPPSTGQIGTWLGRHHTTIMHGLQVHATLQLVQPPSRLDERRQTDG